MLSKEKRGEIFYVFKIQQGKRVDSRRLRIVLGWLTVQFGKREFFRYSFSSRSHCVHSVHTVLIVLNVHSMSHPDRPRGRPYHLSRSFSRSRSEIQGRRAWEGAHAWPIEQIPSTPLEYAAATCNQPQLWHSLRLPHAVFPTFRGGCALCSCSAVFSTSKQLGRSMTGWLRSVFSIVACRFSVFALFMQNV